ncbi:ABC transporter permease [Anatilimnocola floriformis]|uniref:ABC transporter permease n=1 Tax=Anatilimnocola floriformis TaxID=2948575 RepID=UPI0020C48F11|nr:ABC transporter permease [Anatilimnocola floriformis]
MFKFAPYVFKNLWRHRGRTMLTVSGSAVALFVFCFVGAVQQGLERLTSSQEAERTLIVFQENRFCPSSSKLPEDYARTVQKMPGVKDVVPIKVFTNNCRASLDVVVFNGLPPEKLRTARKLELLTGNWGDFDGRTDGAVIGQAIAARRNLKTGQKFTIGDVTVSIVGIFRSTVAAEDNFIYTHLDFLQRARGKTSVGTVTQLEVQLAEGAKPDELCRAIDAGFRSGPVATTTRSKGVFQRDTLSDLAELIGFAHYLGYACVGLVLALVATTTVMAVQDRIKEHAVLQTLGLRPARIFRLVLAESVLQSFAGGLLGIGFGTFLLFFGGFAIGAEGVTIAFQPSLQIAMVGVAVSLVVGLFAGIIPGWQAAGTEIVKALRQV